MLCEFFLFKSLRGLFYVLLLYSGNLDELRVIRVAMGSSCPLCCELPQSRKALRPEHQNKSIQQKRYVSTSILVPRLNGFCLLVIHKRTAASLTSICPAESNPTRGQRQVMGQMLLLWFPDPHIPTPLSNGIYLTEHGLLK